MPFDDLRSSERVYEYQKPKKVLIVMVGGVLVAVVVVSSIWARWWWWGRTPGEQGSDVSV